VATEVPRTLGGLIRSEAAEMCSSTTSGLRGIDAASFFQGLASAMTLGASLRGTGRVASSSIRVSRRAPFFPAARASVVHEQSAHRLGGYRGRSVRGVFQVTRCWSTSFKYASWTTAVGARYGRDVPGER